MHRSKHHLPFICSFSDTKKNTNRTTSVQDESRKRELFQALRVAERGGARTRNTETVDGLGEIVSGQEEFVGRHRGHAAAPVGCEGEEERLLAAVDNGDPNL